MSLLQGILINPPKRELRVLYSLYRVLVYYLRHILVTEEGKEEDKEAFQSHHMDAKPIRLLAR